MNVVSLFTGIGGFDLGLERAGCTVVAQVETDPFCQRVLAARWPRVERADDIRLIRANVLAGGRITPTDGERSQTVKHHVDLLTGGFPCQDLSVAGKRAGLGGAHSSLFHEYVRIAQALRPTWGLVENVPGLLSSYRGRDFWLVLQGLRQCWAHVGWRILDSKHFGVAQRRRRLFLVGGPTADGVAQVLALFEGGGGDSPAGGEAGADIAYCLASRTGGPRYDQNAETFVTAFDPTTSLDQAPNDRTAPPLKVGSGIGIPWAPAIAFTERGRRQGRTLETQDELAYCLMNPGSGGRTHSRQILAQSAIRRLTPLECERLQGFPDGWTCLCQPLAAYADDPDAAALRCRCPDSPRYRALGNAVTVPVIVYLGHRLRAVMGVG